MDAAAESPDLQAKIQRLEEELERQQETIDSLRGTVKRLQDWAGGINAEREREGVVHRRLRRLRAPVTRRIRRLRAPALTLSEQHRPRPLRVPRGYLRVQPPDPTPRVSIVTPSLNQGAFIERTIRSVVDQGYPNLEYVVQDGGSTDETRAVLARYAHQLARATSEADDGQADAINRGFAGTTGEIMAYLNSDDLLLPGSLAHVASYFARHPEVDAVYGQRLVIDTRDQDIGMWVLPEHRDSVLALADFVPQETLFWRRRLWERAGGRIESGLKFAIDWDLLLRFVDAEAKIVRLPRFLGAFRTHATQKTLAITDVGVDEAGVLRDRWHGREMSHLEVDQRLQPFYQRHAALHFLYRLRDFIPVPRVDVMPPGDPAQPTPAATREPEPASRR